MREEEGREVGRAEREVYKLQIEKSKWQSGRGCETVAWKTSVWASVHWPLTMLWRCHLPKNMPEINLDMWAWHTQSRPHFVLIEGERDGVGLYLLRKITNFTCHCTRKTRRLQIINVTF